eukprot:7883289-Alexandrium_andersonii.AAC.1
MFLPFRPSRRDLAAEATGRGMRWTPLILSLVVTIRTRSSLRVQYARHSQIWIRKLSLGTYRAYADQLADAGSTLEP